MSAIDCKTCGTRRGMPPDRHTHRCPLTPKCEHCGARADLPAREHLPACPLIPKCASCGERLDLRVHKATCSYLISRDAASESHTRLTIDEGSSIGAFSDFWEAFDGGQVDREAVLEHFPAIAKATGRDRIRTPAEKNKQLEKLLSYDTTGKAGESFRVGLTERTIAEGTSLGAFSDFWVAFEGGRVDREAILERFPDIARATGENGGRSLAEKNEQLEKLLRYDTTGKAGEAFRAGLES